MMQIDWKKELESRRLSVQLKGVRYRKEQVWTYIFPPRSLI